MRHLAFIVALLACLAVWAQEPLAESPLAENPPPTTDGIARLPGIEIDVTNRQVRVECEALAVEAPLEFFCVTETGPAHETILRTKARPSQIHLGLLMLGLEPGQPARYSESADKWFPPHGPPLNITLEFERDTKRVSLPAHRTMRNLKTHEPMQPLTWVFTGSRVMEDGKYAADVTGYVVSVVNFDLTMIDIPHIASHANELLDWERDPQHAPPAGTKVTMIIAPAGKEKAQVAAGPGAIGAIPAAGDAGDDARLTEVTLDQPKIDRLHELWRKRVAPHSDAMREAAQTHYEVINQLRREQQRLIDEADRIQRVIEELEREYQQMTTPRPEPVGRE